MSLTDLIIRAFCLVDDALADIVAAHGPLRRRGPQPTLADSEVLTIEVVGALLEIDTDIGLYRHFRRRHADLFPALARVHRTTFARQAAALWAVKAELWQHLVALTRRDARLSIVDSFPVPVCRFARATFCQRFADVAAYGRDEVARQTFYGLRAHVRVEWPGVVVASDLAPGNVHDLSMVDEVSTEARGTLLGDRAYWSPRTRERLAERGLALLAPYQSKRRDPAPWPWWLTQIRRRTETVSGQFVERLNAKRVWARDRWHLTSRWYRKLCARTLGVVLCQAEGLPPLRFSALVAD
ncbi:IS982 family transposase [Rubrivirga sp.]|uniref:IS982 family transposase n=1 Tax=Rubrivirga sp. TaxID=1885344 RepID=UPI003B52DE6B